MTTIDHMIKEKPNRSNTILKADHKCVLLNMVKASYYLLIAYYKKEKRYYALELPVLIQTKD